MLIQKCELVVEDRIRGMTVDTVPPPLPPKQERNTISLWDIGPQSMIKIKIVCATNINSPGMQVLFVFIMFSAILLSTKSYLLLSLLMQCGRVVKTLISVVHPS